MHEPDSGNPEGGGAGGSGEADIPRYEAVETDDGDYELVKETINNEFNRIRKDIVESPYKIRDMGIQVAIDNIIGIDDDNEVQYLSQQEQVTVEQGISSILDSMITTSIDKDYGEINPEEKISIVFQPFTDSQIPAQSTPIIPMWMYIVGGALLLIIILLIIMLLRNRKKEDELVEDVVENNVEENIPDLSEKLDTESDVQRKQLEKMAKEKPEDFAKLLRSWLSDD